MSQREKVMDNCGMRRLSSTTSSWGLNSLPSPVRYRLNIGMTSWRREEDMSA